MIHQFFAYSGPSINKAQWDAWLDECAELMSRDLSLNEIAAAMCLTRGSVCVIYGRLCRLYGETAE